MSVHAVVVNWNGCERTLACIHSLQGVTGAPRIHVVDNGSTDGSVAAFENLGDSIHLHRLPCNRGFAVAANEGAKAALGEGAGFVFFVNNDSACDPLALQRFLEAAARWPDAGLFGPRIYRNRAEDRLWACGVSMGCSPNLARLRGHGRRGRGRYEREEEVDSLTGCGLLVRREVFDRIGFFDEDYFVYGEDADFCARARAAGIGIVYAPGAVLEHEGGGSTGPGYGSARKYLTAYHSVLYLKKRGTPALWAGFLILDVFAWPLVFLASIPRGRAAACFAKGRGILHGLLGRPFDRGVLRPAGGGIPPSARES